MTNDFSEWLVKNRDEDGLAELFLELDRRIAGKKKVMINNVRDDKDARLECGAHDELVSFKKCLIQPLAIAESGLET